MYLLADHILEGRLEPELRRMRAEGITLDDMARHFNGRGIPLSRETVRRWVSALPAMDAA